jgi:O-acetyl-ADP-ribose deacetylase (regulator of RNase III)
MVELVQADITTLDVDAIVNAANSSLGGGGGVDGAIHRVAGPELARAATRLAPCPPGSAVLTPGFRLRARFVIHAVGPIWHGGMDGEAELLRKTYEAAFRVARDEPAIRSIAFPAISTGAYGFPKELARGCRRRDAEACGGLRSHRRVSVQPRRPRAVRASSRGVGR